MIMEALSLFWSHALKCRLHCLLKGDCKCYFFFNIYWIDHPLSPLITILLLSTLLSDVINGFILGYRRKPRLKTRLLLPSRKSLPSFYPGRRCHILHILLVTHD